ncbi:hypothetical protein SDJN02_06828, partial [Cucurbita argyrosperma subsp. argyrosperma]
MDADPTSGNLVGHAAKEKEQFGWAIRVLRLNCRISVFLLYALFPLKSNAKTGKVEVAILALTSSQPPWPPVYDFKAKHIFADQNPVPILQYMLVSFISNLEEQNELQFAEKSGNQMWKKAGSVGMFW